jgi:SOS-response transcriptional repressor LexA
MPKITPPENSRLAFYIKLAGLNQAAVADILGITPSTVSQIISGRSGISNQILRALELELGLNPEFIRTGKGKPTLLEEDRQPRQPLKLARIPILKEIPAGKWQNWIHAIQTDLIDGFIDMPEIPGKELFAVRVNDDSMIPRISEGELVIIDPYKVMKELAVVRRPQGHIIRGIQRMGNEYLFKLYALNPEYDIEEVAPDEENVLYVPVKVVSMRDV